jgi:CBS domain-containing protein
MSLVELWRNDPLAEVMTGNVIRIHFDSTLYDAQDMMTKAKLTRMVVADRSGKLRGIITRRDVVRFLYTDKTERALDAMPVREAMSKPVITLRPTDTLSEAAQTMNRKGISSVVVTDDEGQILGIVTKTDLCFHFSLFTSKEKVKDYMTRRVYTVRPTHSIFFVVSLLARQGVSRVPVVDDGIRGIVTLSDIVKSAPVLREDLLHRKVGSRYGAFIAPAAKLTAITASDLMTPNPITVRPDYLLSRAAEIMVQHGISGLPVTDEKGRIRGIVTKTDIVRAVASA